MKTEMRVKGGEEQKEGMRERESKRETGNFTLPALNT